MKLIQLIVFGVVLCQVSAMNAATLCPMQAQTGDLTGSGSCCADCDHSASPMNASDCPMMQSAQNPSIQVQPIVQPMSVGLLKTSFYDLNLFVGRSLLPDDDSVRLSAGFDCPPRNKAPPLS